MRFQAIRNVHPSVVSLYDETEAKDKDGNIVILDQAKVDAETSRLKTEQANTAAQLAADKQSAHDKLSALGLTDAEITALTGGV
ncbi:MAG: hypothetical protein QF535_03795 [Anaerolineales bacterium]|nr:hypothetical protein [Anaerolineales bacterium]